MPIYTRQGDEGSTSRPGGQKVRKSDRICYALGAIDEFNACLGWCLTEARRVGAVEIVESVSPLQGDCLTLGAMVAAAGAAPMPVEITEQTISDMETSIDRAMSALPPLEHFILPGGGELSARLHVARTFCRRMEREVVSAVDAGLDMPPLALKFINRTSDLLFALARLAAKLTGDSEQQWRA